MMIFWLAVPIALYPAAFAVGVRYAHRRSA